MKRKVLKIAIFLGILSLSSIALGTYLKSYNVQASGRIVGIRLEIYEDMNLTTFLTFIDWGFLEANETKTFDCYVKSLSNVPAYFTLETDAWNPINASNYIALSWDYDNTTVEPDASIKVTFSLHVAPDIEGIEFFQFDIIVTAHKRGHGAPA